MNDIWVLAGQKQLLLDFLESYDDNFKWQFLLWKLLFPDKPLITVIYKDLVIAQMTVCASTNFPR